MTVKGGFVKMKHLRVKEAAELLGVKSASVRQLEKRGLLSSVRDWSGHRRFREDGVLILRERFFEEGRSGGAATQDVQKLRQAKEAGR